MKRMLQGLVVCAALCAVTANAVAPYFAWRSQSVNAVRELVGQQTLINRDDMDCFYGVFSITPEFTQTFRAGRLAQCMFGPAATCGDCGATINVKGSLSGTDLTTDTVGTRGNAWLADYFGLSRDFSSTLSFEPKIWNFNIDLNLYLGLDEWAKGLYFRIHAPLTYSKWNLNFCEKNITVGEFGYDGGYFSGTIDAAATGMFLNDPVANLNQSAASFLTGASVPELRQGNGTDITFQKLAYSKFPSCNCNGEGLFRLSDIEMALGWNFYTDCDYHIGLEIRASAPTGNKPCAKELFHPIIGDGGLWKLGGGLTAHAILWRSECDEDTSFGFWLQANVQHMFKACQERVFDLCGKPNSRYMLAMKMQANATDTTALTGAGTAFTPATYVFANEYAPVANLTHAKVDVSVPVEADIVAKFAYTNGNFQWDLGYEFWGRSCEQICKRTDCCNTTDGIASGLWALKGDAYVFGVYDNSATTVANYVVTPLSATESEATIFSGTNFVPGASTVDATQTAAWYNPQVDNAQFAFVNTDPVTAGFTTATDHQNTSIQPVMLSTKDIGYNNAETKGLSNKVFTHLNYTWRDNCDVIPFFGVGASAEFGQSCNNGCNTNNNCNSNCNSNCDTNCGTSCDTSCGTSCNTSCDNACNTSCNTSCDTGCCQQCALNQWAVWLKGGVAW